MKPILTVCPSRERPDRLRTMLESFYATSINSMMLVIVDKDDPTLEQYRKVAEDFKNISLWETAYASNTERLNAAFKNYPFYQFYHITNDDVIYRTPEWDRKFLDILKNRTGIAFGDDKEFSDRLCPTPFIHGNIVRALGWLQMPKLIHLYGDNVWMIIGKMLRNLFYVGDVVIEHMHPVAGKAEMDNVYLKDNSKEMYEHDSDAFFQWCADESLKDVKHIGEVLNKEG